ncbi:MAG: cytochrome c [Candidatus Didemnitutus sp.]|nr:cytochrome c [Candidatus Didemnitutus sp.]
MFAKKLLLLSLSFGAAIATQAATAKNLWLTNCSECHGTDGRGRTKEGKRLKLTDLTNKQVQDSVTDEQIFRITKHGLKDDEGTVMHPTSYRLSDDEIQTLVKHVRKFRKN